MGGFFNIDGPFYRIGNIIADVLILSFVWLFFSIPFFTIGASTTALFYVTTRRISNKEGYLFRDFWKSFRGNFKQATIVWVLLLIIGFVLYVNIKNISIVGDLSVVILPFQLLFAAELFFISTYIFPIIARFDMKFKDLVKTAFFMANKHIFTSLLCLVTGIATVLIIFIYPIYFMVAMGVYAFSTSVFFVRIFKKYRPDLDPDEVDTYLTK